MKSILVIWNGTETVDIIYFPEEALQSLCRKVTGRVTSL
ncbi:hypothetical protein QSI_1964 [Clostridioides difficile P28]|nr:hypothetical protein QSI_1964 [Clostridioides difficile P28]